MKQFAPVFAAMLSAALLPGCSSDAPLEVANSLDAPSLAKGGSGGGGGTGFATRTALPALQKGVHGEAYAINRAVVFCADKMWRYVAGMQTRPLPSSDPGTVEMNGWTNPVIAPDTP